jgi:hypothetical protein
VKKCAVLFVFLTLCFALLGSQHQERTQRTRNFPAIGRVEHSRQDEPRGFALIWEGQPYSSYPYSITPTSHGGYLINAKAWSFGAGSSDVWLIKVDSDFKAEWQKTLGRDLGEASSNCTSQETPDRGFLVFTDTFDFQNFSDIWLLKLSAAGEIEWQRTLGRIGYDSATGEIQQTRDGGYIAVGSIENTTRKDDVLVLKLNSNGDVEWQRSYGELDVDEEGFSIQQTADGGYIVGGSQRLMIIDYGGPVFYTRPLLFKLSESGDIQWQKAFGEKEKTGSPFPKVRQTSDGGYLVADDTSSGSAGDDDVWLAKLSAAGNVQWQKLYGGSREESARDLLPTPDGGCLAVASTSSFGAGRADFWLLKLNSGGNIEWQKVYGTEKDESPLYILPTAEGDYIVTGCSSLGSKGEMMIIKIAPNGEIGPCSLNTNATVTVASLTSEDTQGVSKQENLIIGNTAVIPQTTDEHPILLCSNLHQPPTNISIIREINRSLFVKEYYDHLSWEPDSWNNRFNIVQYRIYRKEVSELRYQLLASVGADVLAYLDGPIESTKEYEYVLTSVDSEGRESPRSLPVKAS